MAIVNEQDWASDVRVSQPVPASRPLVVDFGGFSFTTGGLAHNISAEESENLFTPTYAPANFRR